ncbi:TolC family protein [Caballeronia sp. LZ062]|uniref:TolC family protein n=1 Tax=unclassified Caballeronia TaxID=2646786 RepID=UPI002866E3DC|nr:MULTISPECIES: TolC family protein [unclassified Caballeronia]MDR5855763.1 TolC family protein [Caballeronia sp. LZ050]MDR5872450.1 TolC family protein [Caballeronia sp. LZ062]
MFARTLAALVLISASPALYAQTAGGPSESAIDLQKSEDSQRLAAPTALFLTDVLGLAAEANPMLRGARANLNASSGALMQAGARPNPSISFLQEGFGGTERTSTATVNQIIEFGGKRQARLDVASYGREVATASLDSSTATLRAQVIASFYGLLAAQRQLKVAEESAEIATRSADLADKRAKAGKVSPVEATKARVAASGVQIEVVNARARVSMAAEKLVTVTGATALRNRVVAGDIEGIPDMEPFSELAPRLDDAPLTRAARAEMLRSNAAISVERSKRIPDITLTAGMKRVVTGGTRDNQAVVGISIPLPLFDTNKGALLEAAHKAEKAEADFDSERANLRLELTQAYANYESAKQEAARLKVDVLPAARQALDAMSRGYELGKFSFLDVLDAQRTLFQEQSRYVQALTDAHLAVADIGRLTGTPLPTTQSNHISIKR